MAVRTFRMEFVLLETMFKNLLLSTEGTINWSTSNEMWVLKGLRW